VFSLDGPEGIVQSTEEIVKVATEYYKDLFFCKHKDLFKYEPRPNMSIEENFFSEEEKVTVE
jgi:hypothetical protein